MAPETDSPRHVAGLLLTGGASTRMGTDKASIRLPGGTTTLAERAGALIAEAVSPFPALEVGPGASGLPLAADYGVDDPTTGPLTAVVAGSTALGRAGYSGAAVVLATDLVWISPELLAWLVSFPGEASVVPVVAGRPQPLAARWCLADFERAAELAASGERSLKRVFGAGTAFVGEDGWGRVASAATFSDVDTPQDLERALRRPPPRAFPPRAGR